MQERGHVISVLRKVRKAITKHDSGEIKQLSDQTIHSATIYNDEDNLLVAVVIYALSKIIERGEKYYKDNYHKYLGVYTKAIDKSIIDLTNNNDEDFRKQMKIFTQQSEISGDLKRHLQDMFQKARINKASKIYEHGISMERTANLLGISLWELAEYAGQSNVADMSRGKTIDIKDRLRKAMEIFR
ncbi:MAG: hypothetical protein WC533_02075 [Candidatus Pacearchaeota archaeon]